MRTMLLFTAFLSLTSYGKIDRTDYLHKVLRNLERIETVSFRVRNESYMPGDTIPALQEKRYESFACPADTTLGVKFLVFDAADTLQPSFGYDGTRKAYFDHNEKIIQTDDFTTLSLPFRPVTAPFFSRAESILRYALTTSDRIEIRLDDADDAMHFRLTIDEEHQVEFFGRAYHMPQQSLNPRSVYEIWIRKSDGMPYRIRREMEHETTVSTVYDVSVNTLPATNWQLSDYFPADYAILDKADLKNRPKPRSRILGHEAPAWSLQSTSGESTSLGDFDGKVVLINFTGIGCGACQLAIPFLNGLQERFASADFALVAIESWGKPLHSIRVYSQHNKLEYPLLEGDDTVVKAYQASSAVPVFVLLDRHRIVRKVFEGYSRAMDKEITKAIDTILNESN